MKKKQATEILKYYSSYAKELALGPVSDRDRVIGAKYYLKGLRKADEIVKAVQCQIKLHPETSILWLERVIEKYNKKI